MSAEHDTENRILDAARAVFMEHGFDGARMSVIATRAGINQSMLHYYFRSKGQLFDTVFRKAIGEALPPVIAVLKTDMPLMRKVAQFAYGYIDMIAANPHLPAFVLQELRRNPDALADHVSQATRGVFDQFRRQVDETAERGEIRRIDAAHLLTNLLALCIFPFIARPMLQTAMGAAPAEFDRFLADRRREVTEFIRYALRP